MLDARAQNLHRGSFGHPGLLLQTADLLSMTSLYHQYHIVRCLTVK